MKVIVSPPSFCRIVRVVNGWDSVIDDAMHKRLGGGYQGNDEVIPFVAKLPQPVKQCAVLALLERPEDFAVVAKVFTANELKH